MTGLERGDGTQRDWDALREALRDYIGYVLTSARGLYGEPLSYGPMRMFDALEKSLALFRELGLVDPAVDDVLGPVRSDRWRAGTDPDGFAVALDEGITRLVEITLDTTVREEDEN